MCLQSRNKDLFKDLIHTRVSKNKNKIFFCTFACL
jgi:hypothetical protein